MTDSKPFYRRVVVSTSSQVASQIFVALLGVVALKIMTHALGVEKYGIYATILAFVSTFALLTDLGLNAITAREIAKHPDQANSIISHNMGLRIFLVSLMIPIIFGLSFLFYPQGPAGLRLGILLMSFYLFFDAIRTVSLAYFVSKVRNEITAIINAIQQTLQLILIILAAALGWPIYGYIGIFLFTCIVVSALAFGWARRYVEVRPRANIQRWKQILAMSLSLGALQLINMLYLKADSILLSVLKGTAAVGIYSIAYSLILAFLTLPGFIMTALMPSLATAGHEALKPIIDKALQYMAILACLLFAGSFVVRNDIIPIVSSQAFAAASTPFVILALASSFTYLNSVWGFASVALNKHHKMVYIAATTFLINILLNLLFIPRYSISGAAWATVISECLALIGSIVIFRKQTGINVNIRGALPKPILAGIIALLCTELSRHLWISSSNLLNLIFESIIIVCSYVVLLTLLRAIPTEISEFIVTKLKHNQEN
jgi:O-antigen/teichoic acid export membrane protein